MLTVPVDHAETQLLLQTECSQGGDGRFVIAGCSSRQPERRENIARNERGGNAHVSKLARATTSSREKSTGNASPGAAAGAGKINSAQRQRAADETEYNFAADRRDSDNPLPIANRGNSNVENRCPQAIIAAGWRRFAPYPDYGRERRARDKR